MNIANLQFFAASDLVVMGNNPEMADYDNPRGDIIGHAAFVVAEDDRGNRKRWHVGTQRFESQIMPQAEQLATALNARFQKLGKLPVAFALWQDTYPAYGSPAFSNEEMMEWEMSLEET